MTDEELVRAYREFSEDCYCAGFMSWEHRPEILFLEFPRWLAARKTEEFETYEQDLIKAWREHEMEVT